jgi:hypothetical protein
MEWDVSHNDIGQDVTGRETGAASKWLLAPIAQLGTFAWIAECGIELEAGEHVGERRSNKRLQKWAGSSNVYNKILPATFE